MKTMVNIICALILSQLAINLACAGQSAPLNDMNYIIRITAKNKNARVPFTGSFMTIQNNGSRITRLDQVTPYEISVKADVVGLMVLSLDDSDNNNINAEIIKHEGNEDHVMIGGSGATIFAHEDVEGNGYITARR